MHNLEKVHKGTNKLSLLYVESDKDTATFMHPLLQNLFQKVVFFTNASEALDFYKTQLQENQKSFDVVLCAMNIQEINGFELSRKIKEFQEKQLIFITTLCIDSHYFSDYIDTLLLEIFEKALYQAHATESQLLLHQKNELLDAHIFTTISDMSGNILDISQAYTNFTGYKRDELIGKNHRILQSKHMDKKIIKNLWNTLDEEKPWKGAFRNTKSSGEEYWLYTTINPLYSKDNKKIAYFSINEDITTKKRVEELSTKDQLTSLHNRRHFEYFIKKEVNRIISAHSTIALLAIEIDYYQEYKNNYGYSEAYQLLIHIATLFKTQIEPQTHHLFKIAEAEFGIIISRKDDIYIEEYAQKLLDIILEAKIVHERNPQGEFVTLSIGLTNVDTQIFNITSNDLYNIADTNLCLAKKNGSNSFVSRINEEHISNLKNIDNITKLPNRVALVSKLSELEDEAMLIILHINQLASLKELHGFEFASNVLVTKAQELQEILEDAECMLYNLNLQEFAILITNKNMFYKYLLLLQHSILMTNDSYKDHNGDYFIAEFTAGVAYGIHSVFNHADLSLQEALISKISYKVYENNQSQKQIKAESLNRLKVYKNALHTGNIIPYFQPIVDVNTNEIVKYEALARLETEDGEIISPYHFLSAAKEDKTFENFTRQMMQKVFNIFEKSKAHISINLTYSNINSETMVEYIKNRLEKYGGKGITFEILESEEILDYHVIESFIMMVKEYGCKVSIDDFGSGYSNFTNILKFNIDYIKIDGSLIEKLTTDENVHNMIKGLLIYASNANIKTIAEYVSTQELAIAVKELGIDYIQGYYYGEPKPPEHYGLI